MLANNYRYLSDTSQAFSANQLTQRTMPAVYYKFWNNFVPQNALGTSWRKFYLGGLFVAQFSSKFCAWSASVEKLKCEKTLNFYLWFDKEGLQEIENSMEKYWSKILPELTIYRLFLAILFLTDLQTQWPMFQVSVTSRKGNSLISCSQKCQCSNQNHFNTSLPKPTYNIDILYQYKLLCRDVFF